MDAQRPGEESRDGCCGDKSEKGATRRRPSVRHAKSRTLWASREKRLGDTMADGARARRGDAAIRLCTQNRSRPGPVLNGGVESELTPRDVPDHRQHMGARYEPHQRMRPKIRFP